MQVTTHQTAWNAHIFLLYWSSLIAGNMINYTQIAGIPAIAGKLAMEDTNYIPLCMICIGISQGLKASQKPHAGSFVSYFDTTDAVLSPPPSLWDVQVISYTHLLNMQHLLYNAPCTLRSHLLGHEFPVFIQKFTLHQ